MNRSLIMLVIIGVVVAVIVLTSKQETPTPPTTGSGLTPDRGSDITVLAPLKIVIECEDTTTIDAVGPNKEVALIVRTQNEGVPISFLEMPEDWIKHCGLEKDKDVPGKLPGRASYDFEVSRDDTFYLNLLAKWADDCGKSVYVKLDDGEWYTIIDTNGFISEKSYRWAWHPLMPGGKPKGFVLKKGKHTLYLATREDGPCLDQWLLTTEASLPVGGPAKKTQP